MAKARLKVRPNYQRGQICVADLCIEPTHFFIRKSMKHIGNAVAKTIYRKIIPNEYDKIHTIIILHLKKKKNS